MSSADPCEIIKKMEKEMNIYSSLSYVTVFMLLQNKSFIIL